MVILLEKKGFVFHIDPGPSPVGRLRRAGTLAAADVCIVCNREFLPHFPAQGKRLFGRQGRRMRRAEKEREGGGERRAGQSGRGAAPGMTEEAVCAGKLAGRNGVQEKRKPCVRSSGERGAQKNRAVPGHQRRRRRLHVGHILFALRPCGAGVRGSVPACLRRSICRGAEHQKARQGQNGEKGRLRMSKDGQAGAFIMTSGRHTVQRGPCAGEGRREQRRAWRGNRGRAGRCEDRRSGRAVRGGTGVGKFFRDLSDYGRGVRAGGTGHRLRASPVGQKRKLCAREPQKGGPVSREEWSGIHAGGGETAHRKSGSRACEAPGNAARRKTGRCRGISVGGAGCTLGTFFLLFGRAGQACGAACPPAFAVRFAGARSIRRPGRGRMEKKADCACQKTGRPVPSS